MSVGIARRSADLRRGVELLAVAQHKIEAAAMLGGPAQDCDRLATAATLVTSARCEAELLLSGRRRGRPPLWRPRRGHAQLNEHPPPSSAAGGPGARRQARGNSWWQ